MTPEHVRAFARAVRAPVLLLFAEKSPFVDRPCTARCRVCLPTSRSTACRAAITSISKGAEAAIAERIRRFLDSAALSGELFAGAGAARVGGRKRSAT